MRRMLPLLKLLAVGRGVEGAVRQRRPDTTMRSQPVPDVTDADVDRIVRRDYDETRLEEVRRILEAYESGRGCAR